MPPKPPQPITQPASKVINLTDDDDDQDPGVLVYKLDFNDVIKTALRYSRVKTLFFYTMIEKGEERCR